MIKRSLILILYLLIILPFLNAREKTEGTLPVRKIGFTFSSFGENNVYQSEDLIGAASISGDYFFTLGFNYIFGLNKWLETETGLEYSWHNIIITPNLPPDMDNSPRKENFKLINLPVTLRVNFLKYFFINGGLILDIDASIINTIDNQTGIGSILGFAMKYDFDSGISAFINPYSKLHSIIPFSTGNYHQRIWENGIRGGITYDLSKRK